MNRYSAGHNWLYAGAYAGPIVPLWIISTYTDSPYVATPLNIVLLWVAGFGISYGMIAAHELGHAAAARLVGIEITTINIGHWRRLFAFQWRKVEIVVRAAPSTGYVTLRPSPNLLSAPRMVPMLLAGVATEMGIVAVAALGSFPVAIQSFRDLLEVFCRISIVCLGGFHAIANLWPTDTAIGGEAHATDGAQLLRFWKARSERPAEREVLSELMEIDRLIAAKRFTDARDRASGLAEKHPAQRQFRQVLAAIHAECGATEKAEAIWRELLTGPDLTKNKLAELLDSLCCLPLYHGRMDLLREADAWSNEALRYVPEAITLKGTRGGVLVELGRIDEGLVFLTDVMKKSECRIDHAITAAYLAKAFAVKGNRQESQRWLEKARAVDAEHRVVRRIGGELDSA
jgi:tetratricopeptide (TPR) repeat protein